MCPVAAVSVLESLYVDGVVGQQGATDAQHEQHRRHTPHNRFCNSLLYLRFHTLTTWLIDVWYMVDTRSDHIVCCYVVGFDWPGTGTKPLSEGQGFN